MGFPDGELVCDDFYCGNDGEIGLKRFMDGHGPQRMVFYFRPVFQDAPLLKDFLPGQLPECINSENLLKINKILMTIDFK